MKHLYEFGPFRLDADERLLSREGHPIALPPKVYETLFVLVVSGGRVLTKDDLARATRVWFVNGVRGWVEVSFKE